MLTLRATDRRNGRWVYQAPAAVCAVCLRRQRCTDSTEGRKLNRPFDEDDRERARELQTTEAYKKALRKRQVWVEPLFGEATDWHGLRRFRLRGLDKVNGEALLVAAGQKVKRWLHASGRSHRPTASASPVCMSLLSWAPYSGAP